MAASVERREGAGTAARLAESELARPSTRRERGAVTGRRARPRRVPPGAGSGSGRRPPLTRSPRSGRCCLPVSRSCCEGHCGGRGRQGAVSGLTSAPGSGGAGRAWSQAALLAARGRGQPEGPRTGAQAPRDTPGRPGSAQGAAERPAGGRTRGRGSSGVRGRGSCVPKAAKSRIEASRRAWCTRGSEVALSIRASLAWTEAVAGSGHFAVRVWAGGGHREGLGGRGGEFGDRLEAGGGSQKGRPRLQQGW